MQNAVRDYVKHLGDNEKKRILQGWEYYEAHGHIGDEPLRRHAEQLIEESGANSALPHFWMQTLAFECYRDFAYSRGLDLTV